MLKQLTILTIIATNLCFALPTRPEYEIVGVYVIDGNTNAQQNYGNRRCYGQNCAYTQNQPYIQYPQHNYPQPVRHTNPPQDTIIVLVPEDNYGSYHTHRQNPGHYTTQPTFIRPNRPVVRPTPSSVPNRNVNMNHGHNYPTAVPPTRPRPNVPIYMPEPEENYGVYSNQRPNTPINGKPNQNLNQNRTPSVPVQKPSQSIKSTTSRSPPSDDKASIDDTIAEVFGTKKPKLPVYDIDVRMDS